MVWDSVYSMLPFMYVGIYLYAYRSNRTDKEMKQVVTYEE